MSNEELTYEEARRRLDLVVLAAVGAHGAFGGILLHTTGLPGHDHSGVDTDACALSVGTAELSWTGVSIVRAHIDGEDDEGKVRLNRIEIDNREQLVFLRDALTRLIDLDVLKDEGEQDVLKDEGE